MYNVLLVCIVLSILLCGSCYYASAFSTALLHGLYVVK